MFIIRNKLIARKNNKNIQWEKGIAQKKHIFRLLKWIIGS
jgi:hypothetical protein